MTPVASASVPAPLVHDPAGLVNPFAGTGAAPVAQSGSVGEFPGADMFPSG
jgi:hypothetical protein